LFPTPVAFYALNVMLGALSLYIFYRILSEHTNQKTTLIFTPLLALLPVILWLPSLPMAENLVLPLVILIIWLWFTKQILLKKKVIWLPLLQVALFLTKYSTFTFLIPFNTLFLWEIVKEKRYSELRRYAGISFVIFLGYLIVSQPAFLLRVFQAQKESKTDSELVAFSAGYFSENFLVYLKTLVGLPSWFLWEKIMLVIPGFAFLPFLAFKKKSQQVVQARKLLLIAFGVVFLQSFFYAVDARYLIATVPLIFIATALGFYSFSKTRYFNRALILLTLLVLALLVSQRGFYKRLIASNWFHRSRAWQYEAILHFKQLNLPVDSYLVTALPPYLFTFYYPSAPNILPLSETQEFMNEQQRPWSAEINYQNLLESYHSLLENGETLYISNAYITHLKSVVEDFEEYKNQFELKPISSDCDQACNVYQLYLPK